MLDTKHGLSCVCQTVLRQCPDIAQLMLGQCPDSAQTVPKIVRSTMFAAALEVHVN